MQVLYSRIKGYICHVMVMPASSRLKGAGRMNPHRSKQNNIYEGNIEKRRLEKHKNRMKGGCA